MIHLLFSYTCMSIVWQFAEAKTLPNLVFGKSLLQDISSKIGCFLERFLTDYINHLQCQQDQIEKGGNAKEYPVICACKTAGLADETDRVEGKLSILSLIM